MMWTPAKALIHRLQRVVLILAGSLMIAIGCAGSKVGNMSLEQAFHDPLTTKWISAVQKSDFSGADKLLALGADVNLIGEQEIAPMLWVMGAGRWDAKKIEYMLKVGANPNYIAATRKVSPMHFAAGGDNPEILRLMLKYRGDPNLLGRGYFKDEPILFIAVREGRLDNVEILLQNGANINWLDTNGESAATRALIRGRFDIIFYCLEHGLSEGLDGLAEMAVSMPLPEGDEMQEWKNKVIAILKERGADFNYKK